MQWTTQSIWHARGALWAEGRMYNGFPVFWLAVISMAWYKTPYFSTSYTVGIPIFRLANLYHMILGCDETTSFTSLSRCKFNTPLSLHRGFGWIKLFFWRHFGSVFILNNKNVNALIARELSGFTYTRSLTMNSKLSIPHSAASCDIEIFCSLLYTELVQIHVNLNNSLAECVNM